VRSLVQQQQQQQQTPQTPAKPPDGLSTDSPTHSFRGTPGETPQSVFIGSGGFAPLASTDEDKGYVLFCVFPQGNAGAELWELVLRAGLRMFLNTLDIEGSAHLLLKHLSEVILIYQ